MVSTRVPKRNGDRSENGVRAPTGGRERIGARMRRRVLLQRATAGANRTSVLPRIFGSFAECGPTASKQMVLPVRIELTTSPLPRGCSTTELRQRAEREEKYPPTRRFLATALKVAQPSPVAERRENQHSKHDRKAREKARLAAALRENLKRRKAQAKDRAGADAGKGSEKPHDSAGIGADKPED